MAGLATFNESNIEYRNYIKSAIKLWLDRGVDALRVDTVKHMPIWFWQEFNAEIQTHKPSVFIFGEWGFSKPWDTGSVNFSNHSGMSILDFGLCEAIRAALGKNDSQGFQLVQKIFNLDHLYYRATELITFIDNHDMPRFQSLNGDRGALKLAVGLIMTSRGIPCLYYGTEQYLHNDTNGGNDPYNRPMMDSWDADSPLYKLLALFSKLRRLNPAITLAVAEESIQQRAVLYDKEGDAHFDTISAFIKSVRGSDPDAALYWLAKMVYAGEDSRFILRRLLILASEDIGLADPQAVIVVNACAEAFDRIGLPEGRYHLAQATLYLANTPKSNSLMGFFDAIAAVEQERQSDVPNPLKDSSRDKKGFGHGAGYLYPHAYRDHWIEQQYLPNSLQGQVFYQPSDQGAEAMIKLQHQLRQ